MAIEHALNVLTWYENLQKEDVPPEYLWDDAEGLEQWWEMVEQRRQDGQGTDRLAGRSERSSESDGDDDQDPGMAENDYARFFKKG